MSETIAECGECGHQWVPSGSRPDHPTCSQCKAQGAETIEFTELLTDAEAEERAERRAKEARREGKQKGRKKARRHNDMIYQQGYDQGYLEGWYACQQGYPAPRGPVPAWAQGGAPAP
jgi:hypothetical protein